jgi:hypothetical protein
LGELEDDQNETHLPEKPNRYHVGDNLNSRFWRFVPMEILPAKRQNNACQNNVHRIMHYISLCLFIHNNGNLCVPIVNHYSYEHQNSIPMQISPIVLTLASTTLDRTQNGAMCINVQRLMTNLYGAKIA